MPIVSDIIRSVGVDKFYNLMYNFIETPEGCWKWRGKLDKDGYAYTGFNRKYRNIALYRLWYELWYCKVTGKGMTIDHICRNRACINPKHLELVTTAVNTRRGRSAKLTDSNVEEIRELWTTKQYTQRKIAQMFHVTPATICYLLGGKTWKPENQTLIRVSQKISC